MSYKAKIFTREEFREVVAAAIYDYEQAPAKCLYTTKDAADQLYGHYGEARVKGMHAAPPEIIWRGYGTESRIPKNLFDEYAKGADRLYAYRLENPIRYGKPKTLSDIGLKRAPQSWCYLPETGRPSGNPCPTIRPRRDDY